jgi:DnaK suppressor protein
VNTAELEMFKELLLNDRDRLRAELAGTEESRLNSVRSAGLNSNVPTHPGDASMEGLTQTVVLEKTLRDELLQVNEALDRIRTGSYGTCQQCGKEIGLVRLEAIPQTPYCVTCAHGENEP